MAQDIEFDDDAFAADLELAERTKRYRAAEDEFDDAAFADASTPQWSMKGYQKQGATPRPPKTFLADAPRADILKLGLKAKPEDRLAGARELYPDSMVEGINDGSVVVRRPSGEVYNFEAPDLGNTLVRHARDLIPGLEAEDDSPTVQRALNEADGATIPELVIKGGSAAATAALTVPAIAARGILGLRAIIPHAVTQFFGAKGAEAARAGINTATAGGDTRTFDELNEQANTEGANAALMTAGAGLAARPLGRAADSIKGRLGIKSAASRDITRQLGGGSEGSPALKQSIDDIDALGVPADKRPLSIIERANPEAGPRLKEIYSDPKVADEAAFLEREGQDAVRAAGEGRIREVTGDAEQQAISSYKDLVRARQNARNENIAAKNEYANTKTDLAQEHIDTTHAVKTQNAAAKNQYQQQLDARDAAIIQERNQFAVDRANARNEYLKAKGTAAETDALARYEELLAHQEAVTATRAQNNLLRLQTQNAKIDRAEGIDQARFERAGRQIENRNDYLAAREEQVGAVELARRARNQAIQDIRQSDDVIDEALETAKPRDIRKVLDSNLSPDDPRLADLNSAWTELDMARQPIPRPRGEAPLEPVPRIRPPELEPLPARPVAKPKTRVAPPEAKAPPATPPKPTRPQAAVAPAKKLPRPFQQQTTPEVDAAQMTALDARQRLGLVKNSPEVLSTKATMRAVKESGRRVKPNKPKEMLLSAPARLGVRTAVGLGTAGLSEIPGLAAKFARFARGDKIGRKLITSPEVKNEVLRMLADGIPEKEISAWLVSAAAQASENIE